MNVRIVSAIKIISVGISSENGAALINSGSVNSRHSMLTSLSML